MDSCLSGLLSSQILSEIPSLIVSWAYIWSLSPLHRSLLKSVHLQNFKGSNAVTMDHVINACYSLVMCFPSIPCVFCSNNLTVQHLSQLRLYYPWRINLRYSYKISVSCRNYMYFLIISTRRSETIQKQRTHLRMMIKMVNTIMETEHHAHVRVLDFIPNSSIHVNIAWPLWLFRSKKLVNLWSLGLDMWVDVFCHHPTCPSAVCSSA